ncbi:two-component system sensor histidine kinase YesM [Metabacillus crassostreae]|uniref:sensor histidine kinase n=1 Tax=Metabacillus crassostreae TaxID=929098 RepID=UPI00195EC396|nr:sensor histidine kinase [Metabacillus crassostreae]MBM7603903.1 two-component system sensor histidine kinase YesM [Metabacillus crassostreae]
MWSQIQKKLPPHSFRYKVILTSIICIVIPAIITLFINNYLTKDAMKEQALSNANRELKLAGEYLNKIFEDMLYAANFVQLDSEINTILKKNAKINDHTIEQEEAYESFVEYSKVSKTIENVTLLGEKSYVTILLKNGKHYTNYPVSDYNPENLFSEPWFKELDGVFGYEAVWIGSQPTVFKSEQKSNPYQISVARTLRDSNLKIYGYVIVTIMENKVKQAFESLPGKEEMMLVDSSFKILSHRDNEKIGDKFPYIKEIQDPNFTNIITAQKENFLYADHQIMNMGWKLVSVNPYKQAIFKINSIFQKVFLVQLISFIIFFLLLAYILQTITKPLVHLSNVAETVQSGNLKVRSNVQNKDEIGKLSNSFNLMLDRVNEMISEITETQIRKRKAELSMLQAQINPHFLFNVLNSIRMKVMKKGDYDSAEMISSLSKLLRMTIDQDKGMITFRDEVGIVTDYVRLMNMRQREAVQFEVNVSDTAYLEMIPRFILQPIIENSIIHGLNQSAGKITVEAFLKRNDFFIIIEDNGEGMSEQSLLNLRKRLTRDAGFSNVQNKMGFSSIGITNVYERMCMTFGDAFNMEVYSEVGKGTKVVLSVLRGG